jgi:hypothetical protein
MKLDMRGVTGLEVVAIVSLSFWVAAFANHMGWTSFIK